jgi:hypothetical protein
MFRRTVSDEEFVERIRTYLRSSRKSKKLRRFFAGLGAAMAFVGAWGANWCLQVLRPIQGANPKQAIVDATFWLAVVLGLMMGLAFHKLGQMIAMAFVSDRAESLLVECWDRLHPGPGRQTTGTFGTADCGGTGHRS